MGQSVTTAPMAGIREDLGSIIENLSPSETPVLSAAKTLTATSTLHEWLEDTLIAPSASNAAAEGAASGTVTDNLTQTRLGNYTQISKKVYGVSNTMQSVNNAGFDSAIAYAAAKAARELKTDVDMAITTSHIAKSSSATRRSASLDSWVRNASRGTVGTGTSGADPGTFDGAAVDTEAATTKQRAFTEGLLTDVIEDCWTDGGKPSLIVAGAKQRGVFSGFDGLANTATGGNNVTRSDRSSRTIMGTAEVYVSNYGQLSVVASRHLRKVTTVDRDVWLIDPEQIGVAYLRPWEEQDLAVVGDGQDRMMTVEWTLQVSNTYAHGLIADLN